MTEIEAKVEFYSGGGRDEKPRTIVVDGRRIHVSRIIREYKFGSPIPQGGYHRIFIVETDNSTLWEIREAPQLEGGWELRQFSNSV